MMYKYCLEIAKVQPTADFTKKRVKVGRKVKRENVTKISVKSKVIQMPNQTIQRVASNFNETSSISISKEAVNRLVTTFYFCKRNI